MRKPGLREVYPNLNLTEHLMTHDILKEERACFVPLEETDELLYTIGKVYHTLLISKFLYMSIEFPFCLIL
jgi:hypothetical protein